MNFADLASLAAIFGNPMTSNEPALSFAGADAGMLGYLGSSVASGFVPQSHSDDHYDAAGNHIVYDGTSDQLALDLALGADPNNGALAGQTVHYEAQIGASGIGLGASYSGGDPMVTTGSVGLSGNGFIQSQFFNADGSLTTLTVPIDGFNYQSPVVATAPASEGLANAPEPSGAPAQPAPFAVAAPSFSDAYQASYPWLPDPGFVPFASPLLSPFEPVDLR